MHGDMIWRLQGDRMVLTTFVSFGQPLLGRLTWAWAGGVHRSNVPLLLSRAAHTQLQP